MLQSRDVQDEIQKICDQLNFGLAEALGILVSKIKVGDKEQLKALETWFNVTGNKAPTKTETKSEVTTKTLTEESNTINHHIRNYLGKQN